MTPFQQRSRLVPRATITRATEVKPSRRKMAPPPYRLVSPDGKLHTFTNVLRFEQECGVRIGALRSVLLGNKVARAKGWHLPEKGCKYPVKIIHPGKKQPSLRKLAPHCLVDPQGKAHTFHNMMTFTKKWNLSYPSVSWLLRGLVAQTGGGWHLPGKKPVERLTHRAVDPQGKEYSFVNISAFCREHGLAGPNFHNMLMGKLKTCQGWSRPTDKPTSSGKKMGSLRASAVKRVTG